MAFITLPSRLMQPMFDRVSQEELSKIMELYDRLRITVRFKIMTKKGACVVGQNREVEINPLRADAWTFLHEAGHAITEPMCCKEHAEYAAFGAAVAFGKMLGIEMPDGEREYAYKFSGHSDDCPARATLIRPA